MSLRQADSKLNLGFTGKTQPPLTHFFPMKTFTVNAQLNRPRACIIKLITAVIYGFPIISQCLSLGSQPSLVFESKAGAYLSGAPL